MEKFATAKRLNKEHNRKDTPNFGEIKHIIVEKIIHDHKHELIHSQVPKQKRSQRPTIISVSTFEDDLSEISIYGKCEKTNKIESKQVEIKRKSKLKILNRKKIKIPEHLKQELQNISQKGRNIDLKSKTATEKPRVEGKRFMTPEPNAKANLAIKKSESTAKKQEDDIIKKVKARLLKMAYKAFKRIARTSQKILIFMVGVRKTTNCQVENKFRKVIQIFSNNKAQTKDQMPKNVRFSQVQKIEKKITEDKNEMVKTPDQRRHKEFINLQPRNFMIRRSKCSISIKEKIKQKENLINKDMKKPELRLPQIRK